MPQYSNQTVFRQYQQTGNSSKILDNKFVKYGKIVNKLNVNNLKYNSNIKNKNTKTLNISRSLLSNNSYNRFMSVKPSVVYSLKKY